MRGAVGAMVTFETLPDAVTPPTDNAELAINDAYELDNGVTLRFTFRDEGTLEFTAPAGSRSAAAPTIPEDLSPSTARAMKILAERWS